METMKVYMVLQMIRVHEGVIWAYKGFSGCRGWGFGV